MSYCRFSSDGFKCDVYVYEDVGGGWTTWVASRRIVGDLPPDGFSLLLRSDKFYTDEEIDEQNEKYYKALDEAVREDIDLGLDGERFNHETPGECADNLEYLRGLGYRVPQYAIDSLREDQAETDAERGDS